MATSELHFVLVPLAAQGHIIPMVDVARLLAARGPRVTIVTTPVNAARNRATVDGARKAGLPLELVELPFPGPRLGLPEGAEAIDQMIGLEAGMYLKFFRAIWSLAEPLEEYIQALPRLLVCLVADACNPWTATVCERLGIPRLVMHCPSAYFQLAVHCLTTHGVYDRVGDDDLAPFEIPGFAVRGVIGSKATVRGFFQYPGVEKEHRDTLHAEANADGLLFNTFRGIEGAFLDAYASALGKRTWAVGPTCASSSMADAMAGRGKPADVDAGHIVSWLDSRPPASVLYVSFGSITQLTARQFAKLARGLEASGRPFVWAIKEAKADAAVRALLEDEGFEARVQDRALLVRGWAPQVTILAHPAVGGFLTHCGWNGTLEAVSLGVPTLTWPTIADQFCSEQLLVDVLGVGVRSGVKIPALYLPKEAEGVQMESGDVEKAITELMGGGPEAGARRARAKEIAAEARAAMEEGGSSHSELTDMISYVSELSRKRGHENSMAPAEDEVLECGFSTRPLGPRHYPSHPIMKIVHGSTLSSNSSRPRPPPIRVPSPHAPAQHAVASSSTARRRTGPGIARTLQRLPARTRTGPGVAHPLHLLPVRSLAPDRRDAGDPLLLQGHALEPFLLPPRRDLKWMAGGVALSSARTSPSVLPSPRVGSQRHASASVGADLVVEEILAATGPSFSGGEAREVEQHGRLHAARALP